MKRAEATIDGAYRYDLARYWGDGIVDAKRARFVMLNPSTADAELDDPTIRRCIGFAKREGCDCLTVVNLYAYRATNPRAMLTADDPVGSRNDHFLRAEIMGSVIFGGPLIVAWGANAGADRVEAFRRMVREEDATAYALGITKAGQPKHPLYLPGDAPLIPWEG